MTTNTTDRQQWIATANRIQQDIRFFPKRAPRSWAGVDGERDSWVLEAPTAEAPELRRIADWILNESGTPGLFRGRNLLTVTVLEHPAHATALLIVRMMR